MKTSYLLSAVVLGMVMPASADNLYWNPTTTKKGAGSGVWGDGVAVWSASSGGTDAPVAWVDGSSAYFTLNSGVNTATVDTVTANYIESNSGKYTFLPGTGPLTLGAGGFYAADGSDVFLSDIVLAADQIWRVKGSVSNVNNRISGPGTLIKTEGGSVYFDGTDSDIDFTLVHGNLFASNGGPIANTLTLGDVEHQVLVDQRALLRLHANADGDTTDFTVGDLVVGGLGQIQLRTPATAYQPRLFADRLVRANHGTLYLERQQTFGTVQHIFLGEAPAADGGVLPPWVVNGSDKVYMRYADGELFNVTHDAYTGDWDETKNINVTQSYTLDGSKTTGTVRVASTLTIPEGTSLSLASGGILLCNNAIAGGGSIEAGTNEVVVYSADTRAISPTLHTTGGLTLFGGGTIQLPTLAYTGDTWINQGGVTVTSDDDLVVPGAIRGPGTFTKAGSGRLVFQNNTSSFAKFVPTAGSFAFVDSHFQVSNAVSIGSSDVTLAVTNSYFGFAAGALSTSSSHNNVALEFVGTTGLPGATYVDGDRYGITVGSSASGCSMLVDGGGVTGGAIVSNMVYNTKGLALGTGTNASNNWVRIQNGGQVWDHITVNNAGNRIGMGAGCNDNLFEILGGEGFVSSLYKGYLGSIGSDGAQGNRLVVDGRGTPGSAQLNTSQEGISVGLSHSPFNELVVTNGGWVTGPCICIGYNADSNTVVVSGPGSTLAGTGGNTFLGVGMGDNNGFHAEGNRLLISDGGLVKDHAKWSTCIGGHYSVNMGSAISNGVEVTSGGVFSTPNHAYVGRVKGAGYVADGNYVHVSGKGSAWNIASGQNLCIGAPGAEGTASGNEVVIEDDGTLTARNFYIGRDTSTTAGTLASGNRLVVRTGGLAASLMEVIAGLSGDTNAVALVENGEFIAEQGGVLEGRTFQTVSGNGCRILARDGGVLQFIEYDPTVKPFEPGAIALEDGTISFRVNDCDVYRFTASTKKDGITNLVVRGATGFRLASCTNRTASTQAYVFERTSDPKHFARLEMVGGTTKYRGAAGDTLAIGATGTMLCEDTAAVVALPFTQEGPITLRNATLSFESPATLDAPVVIDLDELPANGAPLQLASDTTLGDGFALQFTGTPEVGMVVASAPSSAALTVTGLPARYKVQYGIRGTGLYSLERPYTLLLLY